MASEALKHDVNNYPVAGGVTDDANLEIVQLRIDPSTKRLKVQMQALAQDTDNISVWGNTQADGAGTAEALLTVDGRLQVDIISGGGGSGGTEYEDGAAVAGGQKGTVAMGTDGSNLQFLSVDSAGKLLILPYGSQGVVLQQKVTSNDLIVTLDGETVAISAASLPLPTGAATEAKQDDIITAISGIGGGGTEYTEDAMAPADPVGGTLMMTRDDSLSTVTEAEGDWSRSRSNARGALWVELDPTNAVAVTGTFWQATQPVSIAAEVDISDQATRLVGVVYGSQGAQLQQKVTSNDLIVTLDGESVAVTIAQDVMLGTDFSDVFGTASLILATQADNVANTVDGLQASSFGYMFDGSTWDRVRGDSTNGLLVNLGTNNDVTVSGDALTALQLIDDMVYVDDADFTASTSKFGLIGGLAATSAAGIDVVTDGDVGPFGMDLGRGQFVNISGTAPAFGQTSSTATTAVQISATSALIRKITITALHSNTEPIYIGGSGVTVTTGFELMPGDRHTFWGYVNLNTYYFRKSTAVTAGVSYEYN